jgi:ATP-dependent DNA helicase RecG
MAQESAVNLSDTVDALPGIGPKRALLLQNLGIRCCGDLLFHLPRDYQDRSRVCPVGEVVKGEMATILAEVKRCRQVRLRGRMSMAVATLDDGTGEINATWFGRGFLAQALQPGMRGFFSGLVGEHKGLALKNPDYELLAGDDEDRLHCGRIVPIYRLTEKVSQRALRRWVYDALAHLTVSLEETLPEQVRQLHEFPEIAAGMWSVHFPESLEAARQARRRFAYEELLTIQLQVLRERRDRLETGDGRCHTVDGPCIQRLRQSLPFALTPGQQRAVDEVLADMQRPRPMMRLLQGDVGCGKTMVALHALAAAADSESQAALMAPTELLAEQHCRTLRHFLGPLGIRVALLTGSSANGPAVREAVRDGAVDVVVGTHALFQKQSGFDRLGLVVVDEQHRFGVLQRDALAAKGRHPDLLQMTATPIPRSLTLTVYGAMDLSVIDELPPGRMPVKTRRIPPGKVPDLHAYLCREAAKGVQTFFVCPLVEESETMELTAVVSHYEELSQGPLAGVRTALLHGRLPSEEKETIVQRFRVGEVDVLFSTTVVEVGVDIPAANIMVIEDAAHFGLTQLHQLRGRVGRSGVQGYCFLLGKAATNEGRQRVEVLCQTTSGFDIAEADLKLRGPGEVLGVRQAGLADLRVADLVGDARLLDAARRDAAALLAGEDTLALGRESHPGDGRRLKL